MIRHRQPPDNTLTQPAMNPPAPDSRRSADDRAALISALVDGEAQAVQPGCELWRDDAQARSTWHTWRKAPPLTSIDRLPAV